jgi:cell fate regulator YaaT (PSP1 superfamily)
MAIAKREDRLLLGVIYQVEKPTFHKELYGEFNPVTKRMGREERIKQIESLLSS